MGTGRSVVLAVLIASCTTSYSLDHIPDDKIDNTGLTWVNQLGLAQLDTEVWRDRLETACSEGVWDPDVALRLAEQFIEEDEGVSARDPSMGPPDPRLAADALWIMAVQVCRDEFPEVEGPPFG